MLRELKRGRTSWRTASPSAAELGDKNASLEQTQTQAQLKAALDVAQAPILAGVVSIEAGL